MIWWYVAAIDEDAPVDEERLGEEKFDVALFSYEEAVKILTFQFDRDTVEMAINLVKETYDRGNEWQSLAHLLSKEEDQQRRKGARKEESKEGRREGSRGYFVQLALLHPSSFSIG